MHAEIAQNSRQRLGSVSSVILSPEFTHVLVLKDLEKSSPEKQIYRLAIPGGDREAVDNGDIVITLTRELLEEVFPADMSYGDFPIKPKDLLKIPFEKNFGDGTKHEYLVTLLSRETPLKKVSTFERVCRDGRWTDMEVLAAPEWMEIGEILFAPTSSPSERYFLHYTHLRAVVEALIYLKARLPHHAPILKLWDVHGVRIEQLQRRLASPRN